ncbi:MAG: hypothetical protein KDA25_13545 [Phycisphaerales bacterium]|nr:hypothetical protein [Phycisphaerales bacterium]
MAARHAIAIDFGRRGLRAVRVDHQRGHRQVVREIVSTAIPGTLDRDDIEAAGRWLRACLDDADIGRGRATIAISREDLIIKRLTLPTTEAQELPEMTRLAMQRELAFNPDGAVIDFIPLSSDDTKTTVLAGAIPSEILDRIRAIAREAGLSVARISPRALGAAALVSPVPDASSPNQMLVDIAGERIEFVVIIDGLVHFARAGELPCTSDPSEIAAAVVTEARRTWMSFRMGSEDPVHRVSVMGDLAVVEAALEPLHDVLELPVEAITHHDLIDAGGRDMDGVWPLAGLLLADATGRPTIDFANPTKAPDLAARRRQLVLGVVGLLIVLLAGGFMLAQIRLARLDAAVDAARTRYNAGIPDRIRYKRDVLKLRHLELWQTVRPDWLAHLRRLAELEPDEDRIVLDRWTGTLDFGGVQYSKPRGATEGEWTVPYAMSIVLDGEANDRAMADRFRDVLVNGRRYIAQTTGPDGSAGRRLPFAFKLILTTEDQAPPETTTVVGRDGAEPKADPTEAGS